MACIPTILVYFTISILLTQVTAKVVCIDRTNVNNDGYTECSSVPVPGTAPNGYENCCNLNVKTGVLTSQCCPIPDANGTHCVPSFKTSTCFCKPVTGKPPVCTPESYGPFRGSSATGVDMCCVRSASNGGITGRQCCENKYKENFWLCDSISRWLYCSCV